MVSRLIDFIVKVKYNNNTKFNYELKSHLALMIGYYIRNRRIKNIMWAESSGL